MKGGHLHTGNEVPHLPVVECAYPAETLPSFGRSGLAERGDTDTGGVYVRDVDVNV